MYLPPQNFLEKLKANLEHQIALAMSINSKYFDGFEKMVDLHVAATKLSLTESRAKTEDLLSINSIQEFLDMTATSSPPTAGKMLGYCRNVAIVSAATQVELSKVFDAEVKENILKIMSFIDSMSSGVPMISGHLAELLKTGVSSVNIGFETFRNSTKKAAETLEASIHNGAQHFADSAHKNTVCAERERTVSE